MSARPIEARRPGMTVLAWTLTVAAVLGLVVAAFYNLFHPGPGGTIDSIWFLSWLGFPIVGAVIVSRLPTNRLGWLLVATGSGVGLGVGITGTVLIATADGLVEAWVPWAAAVTNPLIAVGFLSVPFVVLLFPDDEVGGRWRMLAKVAAALAGVTVVASLFQPVIDVDGRVELENPIPGSGGAVGEIAQVLLAPLGFGMAFVGLASLVKLVVRYRRSSGVERFQMKWVAFAAALFPPLWLTGVGISYTDEFWGQLIVYMAFVVALEGIALAIGIAILRYRLFDIDVVINKTLVFVSLAVLITVVYVGIVVGVGRLVGAGDEPSLLLSIVATSVVAVGFQPARRRLQRWANRVVFGERATPYEVLAGFSRQAADTDGDVFGEVCRLLVEGTAAEWAVIRRVGAASPLVVWPEGASVGGGVTRSITHEGEVMGELEFGITAGESLTSAQSEVVDHLVAALGLLLRNAQMTAELQTQVHQLEDSRNRIVAAGDEVRRRIETQLTEGPLATLDEIIIQLQELDVEANGSKTGATIESVTGVIDQAKQAVMDFAQGVFPPVLEEHGLEGALRQRADTAPLPVVVESDLTRRYPSEIEAALYFIAAEALQNTIKYANATKAVITLTDLDGDLTLVVSDDGEGFDPDTVALGTGTTNTRQRIDTVGGTLTLTSTPGNGTTLHATVPRREEMAHAD